jgi:hypothetical protein
MYFWRIGKLKQELKQGPLPPRRALPYVGTWLALLTFAGTLPAIDADTAWEWTLVLAVYYGIATAAGVWWSYRANGGANGADFSARLLALWWVLGIRFLVISAVPVVLLYAVLAPQTSGAPGAPLLADTITALIWTVPYYWRAAVHMRDLRRADIASQLGVQPVESSEAAV